MPMSIVCKFKKLNFKIYRIAHTPHPPFVYLCRDGQIFGQHTGLSGFQIFTKIDRHMFASRFAGNRPRCGWVGGVVFRVGEPVMHRYIRAQMNLIWFTYKKILIEWDVPKNRLSYHAHQKESTRNLEQVFVADLKTNSLLYGRILYITQRPI